MQEMSSTLVAMASTLVTNNMCVCNVIGDDETDVNGEIESKDQTGALSLQAFWRAQLFGRVPRPNG